MTLTVTPDPLVPWVDYPFVGKALDVPGLGLAYSILTRVVAVEPGSPAEKAGIKPGDRLTKIAIPPFDAEQRGRPTVIGFEEGGGSWPKAFMLLQMRPIQAVELTVNNATKPVSIAPAVNPKWFHPYRGEQFRMLFRRTPPMGVSAALQRGWDDTVENILSIYAMIRSLVQGRVGPENLGGPGVIGVMAFRTAKHGSDRPHPLSRHPQH